MGNSIARECRRMATHGTGHAFPLQLVRNLGYEGSRPVCLVRLGPNHLSGAEFVIERLDYTQHNSKAINALAAVNKHITSIDPKLRALLELRISQINGCVYCVDLHAEQARDAGETQQRLDCLAVWEECPFFDDRERAALAWSEAITHLPESAAPDDDYELLGEYFSDAEIVDLTLIATLMNAWNRLAVSFRHLPEPRNA